MIDLLFWVISGIREDTRIDTAADTVIAVDDDSVMICLDKLVVKKDCPGSLKKLPSTMR